MWHVAFKVKAEEGSEILSEHLRYAGTISTTLGEHSVSIPSAEFVKLDVKPGQCVIVIHEPKGINGKIWAAQNADRIRSFGTAAIAYKQ
jgi:hypothetical protein